MIRRCRIPIAAFFRALQPNSDRSAVPLEKVLSQARVRAEPKTATGLVEWFYGLLTHGPADGGTRLSVIGEKGGRHLTALQPHWGRNLAGNYGGNSAKIRHFLRRHCGT